MATMHGVLGQAAPSGAQLTTIYTAPTARHATARVIVTNRSGIDLFRIAVSPAGAAIENKHYIAYDKVIAANDSISSAAFTVKATDVVRVYATNGNLSFTLTGIEEDG